MPNSRCPSCEREVNLPDGLAGNTVRCPACGAAFKLPDKPGISRGPSPGPLDSVLAEIDPEQIFAAIKLPSTPPEVDESLVLDVHEDGPLPADVAGTPAKSSQTSGPDSVPIAPAPVDTPTAESEPVLATSRVESSLVPPEAGPSESSIFAGDADMLPDVTGAIEAAAGVPMVGLPATESRPVEGDFERRLAHSSAEPHQEDDPPLATEGEPALAGGACDGPHPLEQVAHDQHAADHVDLSVPPSPPRRRRFFGRRDDASGIKRLVAILLIAFAIVGGWRIYHHTIATRSDARAWEREMIPRLRQTLAEIDELDAQGRHQAAFDKADALWQQVVNRHITDQDAVCLGEQVRVTRARLELILAGAMSRPATGTAPIVRLMPTTLIASTRVVETQPAATRPIEIAATAPATIPSTVPAQVASTAPATSPVTRPTTLAVATRPLTEDEQLRQTFASLLQQATNALASGEAQAALETLFDAQTYFERRLRPRGVLYGSPEHLAVLHGMAMAHLLLDKPQRAETLFQSGSPLDRACAAKNATRQLLVTRGLADAHSGLNALRSAMRLCDYIKAHPGEIDTEMLDVLFTLLERAEDRLATRSPALEACRKTYDVLNARLEQTRPGYRRWGVLWVTQDEHARFAMKRAIGVQNYEFTVQRQAELSQAVAAGERALDEAKRTRMSQVINAASERLAADRRAREKGARALEQARARIPDAPILSREQRRQLLLPREVAIATAIPTPVTGSTAPGTVASRKISGGLFNLGGIETSSPATQPVFVQAPASQPAVVVAPPSIPIPVAAPPSRRSFHRAAAGFAVAPDLILTCAAPLANASSVTIEFGDGQQVTGTVHRVDAARGLALLKIPGQSMAYLNLAEKPGPGPVVCPCYPEVSLFGARQMDVRGFLGTSSTGAPVVNLERHPRLAGSPLLDGARNVVAMEYADRDASPDKCPIIPVESLRAFLDKDAPTQLCGNPSIAPIVQVTAMFAK